MVAIQLRLGPVPTGEESEEESERELPPLFRASAIQSLVPALPSPTLPVVSLSPDPRDPNLTTPPLPPDDNWQPLLPPTADVFFDGARPGAGFVLRSHLQRQFLKQETVPSVDVSGSIPVEHRMPRPVPLRPNLRTGRDAALRTWRITIARICCLPPGRIPPARPS